MSNRAGSNCASTMPSSRRVGRLGKLPRRLQPEGISELYVDHVMQADVGADFDFLVGCRGADVPRESH